MNKNSTFRVGNRKLVEDFTLTPASYALNPRRQETNDSTREQIPTVFLVSTPKPVLHFPLHFSFPNLRVIFPFLDQFAS